MDPQLDKAEKKPATAEVVLVMHDDHARTAPASPAHSTGDSSRFPEIRRVGSTRLSKPSNPRHKNRSVVPDEEPEEYDDKEIKYPDSAKKKRSWGVKWGVLVLAMVCLVASLVVRRFHGGVIRGYAIWKWSLMAAVIFSGLLLSQWFIDVLLFLLEKNFLFKDKALYFAHGIKKTVPVCIWSALVLLVWCLLFTEKDSRSSTEVKVSYYVTRALASIFVASFLWLVKIVLVKTLASSFHTSKFFERIQESIFHQNVLQTLSGPPGMELAEKVGRVPSNGQLSFRVTGKGKGKVAEEEVMIALGKLHNMRKEKVSAWTMKNLMNVISTTGLSTISNTLENYDDEEEKEHKKIESESEAKDVAHRVFKNVAKPDYNYIERDDLLRFLSKDEVAKVLPLFEGASDTGKIKRSAFKNWVVKIYLDRKSLASSLNDSKTVVHQLHKIASVVAVMVIIVITLLVMGIANIKLLILVSSQYVLVGLLFGNTCKAIFEGIVFIFAMHPFDVGDRCVVDGVQVIVEELNILMTTFLRYDNEKIYYPNTVLATKPIGNFNRSPEMKDVVEFAIDFSTTMDSIEALKSKIKEYIENKPKYWQANHSITVKDIIDLDKMVIALSVRHTINFQNWPERNSRRTDLIFALKNILEQLSIKYQLLPQEVKLSYTGSTPLPMSVVQNVFG